MLERSRIVEEQPESAMKPCTWEESCRLHRLAGLFVGAAVISAIAGVVLCLILYE